MPSSTLLTGGVGGPLGGLEPSSGILRTGGVDAGAGRLKPQSGMMKLQLNEKEDMLLEFEVKAEEQYEDGSDCGSDDEETKALENAFQNIPKLRPEDAYDHI